LEGIRISRQGFPNRLLFKDFCKRYSLFTRKKLGTNDDFKNVSKTIIDYLVDQKTVNPDQFQFGLTKIFFRTGQLGKIEEAREAEIGHFIPIVQACSRGFIGRKILKIKKDQAVACTIMQRVFREQLVYTSSNWYLLYSRVLKKIRRNKMVAILEMKVDNCNADLELIRKQIEDLKIESDNASKKCRDNYSATQRTRR